MTFDAEGCGAAIAAGSACVSLVDGRAAARGGRASAPADVAAELGGLSPGKFHAADLAADALHRALARRWPRRRAARGAEPGRVLVAMSGGVDSAVAALLERAPGARSSP